ncbi:MAG: hypothetical protein IJS54_01535 [Desulfovibrio sp.]|nr:hypothetical protein [Desulfovibrio sp.]
MRNGLTTIALGLLALSLLPNALWAKPSEKAKEKTAKTRVLEQGALNKRKGDESQKKAFFANGLVRLSRFEMNPRPQEPGN